MLACGLAIDCDGAATLAILEPGGEGILHTSRLEPPLEKPDAARWIRELANRFAPEPLWIALIDIRWHWLDDLGTLPVRWVHYLDQALCGHYPDDQETPADISREALALARALNADLNDLRLYHEELFNLRLIRDSAQRLTEVLPYTRRLNPFLRDHIGPIRQLDDVPF